MVRRNEELVSDTKVEAATGKGREHWFALLDEAGAVRDGWTHARMAQALVDAGVSPWWAQGITVAYEQARGLRQPGQRPDGSFDASASKTLAVSLEELWPWLVDSGKRRRWLGAGYRVTGQTEGTSVRLAGPDGAKVVLNFYGPVAGGGSGVGAGVGAAGASAGAAPATVRLQAQVGKLAHAETAATMKEHWKAALAKLAELVD